MAHRWQMSGDILEAHFSILGAGLSQDQGKGRERHEVERQAKERTEHTASQGHEKKCCASGKVRRDMVDKDMRKGGFRT